MLHQINMHKLGANFKITFMRKVKLKNFCLMLLIQKVVMKRENFHSFLFLLIYKMKHLQLKLSKCEINSSKKVRIAKLETRAPY